MIRNTPSIPVNRQGRQLAPLLKIADQTAMFAVIKKLQKDQRMTRRLFLGTFLIVPVIAEALSSPANTTKSVTKKPKMEDRPSPALYPSFSDGDRLVFVDFDGRVPID